MKRNGNMRNNLSYVCYGSLVSDLVILHAFNIWDCGICSVIMNVSQLESI